MDNQIRKQLRRKLYELSRKVEYPAYNPDEEKEHKAIRKRMSKIRKDLYNMAPEIKPGGEYNVDDFNDRLKYTGKTDNPEKRFIKDHSFEDNEIDILKDIIWGRQGIYNWFNKNYHPFEIGSKVLEKEKEKVESSNIYDKMEAKTMTTSKVWFKVKLSYMGDPVTISKIIKKDTTLSRAEIQSFMRF